MTHRFRRGRGFQCSLRRATFNQIMEVVRLDAAEQAWHRAVLVGRLRHDVHAHGNYRAARLFARLKQQAVRRACELAPEYVRVGIDDQKHVGLLSVAWNGLGRLHLPAATETCDWRRMDFCLTQIERIGAATVDVTAG